MKFHKMTVMKLRIPTVGFNVETVAYKNVKFNVWVSLAINFYFENINILTIVTP